MQALIRVVISVLFFSFTTILYAAGLGGMQCGDPAVVEFNLKELQADYGDVESTVNCKAPRPKSDLMSIFCANPSLQRAELLAMRLDVYNWENGTKRPLDHKNLDPRAVESVLRRKEAVACNSDRCVCDLLKAQITSNFHYGNPFETAVAVNDKKASESTLQKKLTAHPWKCENPKNFNKRSVEATKFFDDGTYIMYLLVSEDNELLVGGNWTLKDDVLVYDSPYQKFLRPNFVANGWRLAARNEETSKSSHKIIWYKVQNLTESKFSYFHLKWTNPNGGDPVSYPEWKINANQCVPSPSSNEYFSKEKRLMSQTFDEAGKIEKPKTR